MKSKSLVFLLAIGVGGYFLFKTGRNNLKIVTNGEKYNFYPDANKPIIFQP